MVVVVVVGGIGREGCHWMLEGKDLAGRQASVVNVSSFHSLNRLTS